MRVTLTSRLTVAFPKCRTPLECLPYRDVFEAAYDDDRHFLPYWISGSGASLRVRKAALKDIRALGHDLQFQVLVLDFDHITEPPEHDEHWGHYRTKHGFRLFAELTEPIGPEHYEEALTWARSFWPGADAKCKDWSHIYRLPRVVREGERQETEIVYPTAQVTPPAYTPKHLPVIAPAPVTTTVTHLEQATTWIAEAPPAIEGQGGDLHTFRVAEMLVRGYALPESQALTLLREWNLRCQPPWDDARLVYKLEQALEHGKMPPGAAVFTIRAAEPRAAAVTTVQASPGNTLLDVQDLFLARFLGAELNKDIGPVSSLNKTLYTYRTGEWIPFSDREFYSWIDRWEGRSPDPQVYKPIVFSFSRAKSLRENLAIRFDVSDEIRDRANILFYTKQGAVTLDGIVPYTPCIGIQVLPKDWHSQDDCPRFQQFLDEILPKRDQEFIRDFVGLCLLGRGAEAQTALMCEGIGANGKSVLLLIISRLFPDIYKACVPPRLMNDETKLWPFRLAKINIVSDLSLKNMDDPAGLKQVVAGDEIMARRLYENPQTIKPIAGHIFSANLPPRADDVSQAFIRRWLIIYFSRKIPEEMQVQGLDSILWEAESVGICKWFMLGAANVAQHGLQIPQHARQEMKDWYKDQDPLRRIVTQMVGDLDEFSGNDMLDKVNIQMQREGHTRVPSTKVAEFYRSLGYVSVHIAGGSKWTRRELKLVKG